MRRTARQYFTTFSGLTSLAVGILAVYHIANAGGHGHLSDTISYDVLG